MTDEEWIVEPKFPIWAKCHTYEEQMKICNLHLCYIPCKQHLYGAAIIECAEDLEGRLFVENGEYGSQVNYCPMCGYEAKVKID